MKINKNIPLEMYTDNVRDIILTPYGSEYTTMLTEIPEEDLNTALRLMREYNTCVNKQKAVNAELCARIPYGGQRSLPEEWKRWFKEQWIFACAAIRSKL